MWKNKKRISHQVPKRSQERVRNEMRASPPFCRVLGVAVKTIFSKRKIDKGVANLYLLRLRRPLLFRK